MTATKPSKLKDYVQFYEGDKVWSDYFKDYLIITRIIDENNWYFYRNNDPLKVELKAQTPLYKFKKSDD